VLERRPEAGGAINVVVRRLTALNAPDLPLADVVGSITAKSFSMLDEAELARQNATHPAVAAGASGDAAAASGFRAVAPQVQSFASGRRR
jgi:hypothetical protein